MDLASGLGSGYPAIRRFGRTEYRRVYSHPGQIAKRVFLIASGLWIKAVICLLVAAVIALAAWIGYVAFLFDQSMAQSERHEFHYSISLLYTPIITNVTILLPIPTSDGTPILADNFAQKRVHGIPDDWDLSIEEVNGIPMLAIRAERMVPEYRGLPIAIEPGQSPLPTTVAQGTEYSPETPVLVPVQFDVMLQVNRTIETCNPIGREPVFAPGEAFTPVEESTWPHREGKVYTHSVPVYVWFEREQAGEFSLQAIVRGINSIWRGGWIFNSFQDSVSVELKEPAGWTEAGGILRTGEGVYYT